MTASAARRRGLFAAVVATAALVCPASSGAQPPAPPQRVTAAKAAFLDKFLLFTDLPPEAFDGDTVTICLLGESLSAEAFAPVVGSRRKGRALAVTSLPPRARDDQLASCQLLFFGDDVDAAQAGQLVGSLAGKPVLTVGEHEAFLEWGGMIRVFRHGTRLGFEINATAADAAAIRFRAQMLRIARRVVEEPL